jgi:hypothetical protein
MSKSQFRKPLVFAAAALWLGACCAVLVVTLAGYEPGPRADAGQFFILAMLALTFPAGLLPVSFFAALAAIGHATGTDVLGLVPASAGFITLWLFLLAVGYLQWFRGLPWLWRKVGAVRHPV